MCIKEQDIKLPKEMLHIAAGHIFTTSNFIFGKKISELNRFHKNQNPVAGSMKLSHVVIMLMTNIPMLNNPYISFYYTLGNILGFTCILSNENIIAMKAKYLLTA